MTSSELDDPDTAARSGGGGRSLARAALAPVSVLGIAMAAISPTTSVFLVYGEGLGSAGTGVVWAFVIGAAIALSMALCYAEVGSVFPSAGGAYTIVRRALGPVWGGLATVLFLVLGITSTASILTAAATYLSSVVPGGLPVNWVALAMMVLVTALSMGRVNPAGWVAVLMLVLEVVAILAFTAVAFWHLRSGNDPFGHPVVPRPGDGLATVGAAGLLAAVVPALFAFNGYDWPLYFAEETRGASRRVLPRAVLLSCVLCVVLELAAVLAATYAIRDLPALGAAESPLTELAHQVMGPVGATVLLIGVVVAMFDTGLAANLGYARIYYAAGRDGLWPGPVGGFFRYLGRRSQVPVGGFLVLFVGNGLLCVFSSLNTLITFTGVVIVIVYTLVAVSALVVRIRDRRLRAGFRMPLWPLPPLVALAGIGIALSQQKARNLVIAGGVAVLALLAYLWARRRLPARLERAPSDTGPGRESDSLS